MKLNSALVECALDQFEAQAIPDNHPVVPQLNSLFGDHTFFLNGEGLSIVEPTGETDAGAQTAQVVKIACWNDNDKTSLRMGVDVPVPQKIVKGGEGVFPAETSYSYRSVGTNIDCSARTIGEGLFKLDLAVSDTSVFVTEKEGTAMSTVRGVPAFRSFTSTFNVLLKDGQTAQHTAATDPVSGEVLRVDVTLNVLK